ncbi:exodeoxyribonuclease VII small subunit [Balneicella halophila]|uniref:Exodeoxyribonuclease VII small subunit n=1 Tax=Balneicella halophila TaxID=1537566 RepID=A0A7L4US11_BALHA|nr:exodeoxyribonuclease VII small subunit [Balneicella halophila]PVX52566.1 exodeoxyribonuclease VII small subunit [Balneicella halophila]
MARKKMTYSEAMAEIEQVIKEIENDELDVDLLSVKVKRVAYLLEVCKNKLYKTEQEVEEILKDITNAKE